jgi:hypothetical protein
VHFCTLSPFRVLEDLRAGEGLSAGFIFLDRWLLVPFADSLNSYKCGSLYLAALRNEDTSDVRHSYFLQLFRKIEIKPALPSHVRSCKNFPRSHVVVGIHVEILCPHCDEHLLPCQLFCLFAGTAEVSYSIATAVLRLRRIVLIAMSSKSWAKPRNI